MRFSREHLRQVSVEAFQSKPLRMNEAQRRLAIRSSANTGLRFTRCEATSLSAILCVVAALSLFPRGFIGGFMLDGSLRREVASQLLDGNDARAMESHVALTNQEPQALSVFDT